MPCSPLGAQRKATLETTGGLALQIECELRRSWLAGETTISAPPTGFRDLADYECFLRDLDCSGVAAPSPSPGSAETRLSGGTTTAPLGATQAQIEAERAAVEAVTPLSLREGAVPLSSDPFVPPPPIPGAIVPDTRSNNTLAGTQPTLEPSMSVFSPLGTFSTFGAPRPPTSFGVPTTQLTAGEVLGGVGETLGLPTSGRGVGEALGGLINRALGRGGTTTTSIAPVRCPEGFVFDRDTQTCRVPGLEGTIERTLPGGDPGVMISGESVVGIGGLPAVRPLVDRKSVV